MIIESRTIKLNTRTGVEVERFLPHAKLKTIGAWCFVDHFGPTEQTESMVVAAHPHMGLQTVTWIFEGQVEHSDSLGSIQLLEAGELNLMTAGKGISHSEISKKGPSKLHAMQLWVALPSAVRGMDPMFEHFRDLPTLVNGGLSAKIFAGAFMGQRAKTRIFSEMVGVEITLKAGTEVSLELDEAFEYGLIVISGAAEAGPAGGERELLSENDLGYWPLGEKSLELSAGLGEDLVAVLLGGVPFPEKILMWWNFVARTHEEIVLARTQWNARDSRFGSFEDQIGGWIPAPEMPNVTLSPR